MERNEVRALFHRTLGWTKTPSRYEVTPWATDDSTRIANAVNTNTYGILYNRSRPRCAYHKCLARYHRRRGNTHSCNDIDHSPLELEVRRYLHGLVPCSSLSLARDCVITKWLYFPWICLADCGYRCFSSKEQLTISIRSFVASQIFRVLGE
jgi:hypothetical protein